MVCQSLLYAACTKVTLCTPDPVGRRVYLGSRKSGGRKMIGCLDLPNNRSRCKGGVHESKGGVRKRCPGLVRKMRRMREGPARESGAESEKRSALMPSNSKDIEQGTVR